MQISFIYIYVYHYIYMCYYIYVCISLYIYTHVLYIHHPYILLVASIYEVMGMRMSSPASLPLGLLSRGRNCCGRGHFQRSHRARGIRGHGGRGHGLARRRCVAESGAEGKQTWEPQDSWVWNGLDWFSYAMLS